MTIRDGAGTDRRFDPVPALHLVDDQPQFPLDAAGLGTWRWTVATDSLVWSPRQETLHGLAPGAFGGTRSAFLALVHADDRERVAAAMARALADEADLRVEYRTVWPDGTVRWIVGRGRVLRDDAGEPIGLTGIALDVSERTQAEEALRQSRNRLELILRGVADGITLQAPSGELLYANDAAARLAGYPNAEAFLAAPQPDVMRRYTVLDEGGRPVPAASLPGRLALRGEQPPEALLRFAIPATGEERWAIVRAIPVLDERGAVRFAINVFRDVTDERRAEQALRDSEARYRLLFESNPHPMWVFDLETLRFLAVNDAAVHQYGWSREEFLDLTLLDVRPPEEAPAILAKVARVTAAPDGLDVAGVWRHRRKDGRVFDAEVTTHAIVFDGRPARLSLAIDVTERTRAVVALRESEERFRQLADNVNAAFWITELPERRVVYANPAFDRLFGLDRRRLYEDRRSWLHAIHPDDQERAEAAFNAAFLGPEATNSYEDEYRIVLPTGEVRWVRDRAFPVRNEAGRVYRVAGITEDITERRRAEERERFLAGAAEVLAASLDYRSRLEAVAGLAVPELADWCVVDILGDDGLIHRVAIAHRDRHLAAVADELRRRYPVLAPDADHTIARVLASGRPWLDPKVDPERFRAQARDPEHLALLERLGYRAEMVVPMIADGRGLGTMTLVLADSRRTYDAESLALAQELARRCAVAIQNARLYQAAQEEIAARRAAEAERERLLVELDAERALLEAVLQQLPVGVVIAEAPSGRIVLGNTQMAIISGRPFDPVADVDEAGRYTAFYPDGRPYPLADYPGARAIRAGEVVTGEELAIRRADGTLAMLRANAAPIRDREGRIIAGVATFDDVTDRKRAEDAQRFLAEASAVLFSSLDYEDTLGQVARLAVPHLADLCVVDVLRDDGSCERLVIAHADPAKEAVAQEIELHYPLDSDERYGAASVLRTGRSELLPTVSADVLAAMARDAGHLTLLQRLGVESLLAVPLAARGRTLGVLSLIMTERGRRYGPDDLPLAEELARRAALAVDNARLYAAERRARRDAESATARTVRLQTLTAALAETLTPATVAEVVVDRGIAAFGASAGLVVLPTVDGRELELARAVGYPEAVVARWRRCPAEAPVAFAEAVRDRQPVLLGSVEAALARYPHLRQEFAETGTQAFAAIPLLVEGRAVGALGLSFAEPRVFSGDDLALMRAITDQAAQAVERTRLYQAERRARDAVEVARQRLAFLAEASAVLSSSLDDEATLRRVADLVVPKLADWCTVYIVSEAGVVERLVVAHADPAQVARAEELLRRYPEDGRARRGVPEVLRTGRSELYPVVDEALLSTWAQEEEHRAILRRVGLSSAMIVPLVVHGRPIGAISFVATESGRHYDRDDLAFAEDLAHRCAVAVDNARLYAAERRARDQAEVAERAARRETDRIATLARLSRALAETGLDFQTALDAVARITAEQTGDCCIIRLLSEDGEWADMAAVQHPDSTAHEAFRALVSAYRQRVDDGLPASVLQTGEPLLVPVVTADWFTTLVRPEFRSGYAALGIRSLLVVPLRARGRTFGSLTLLRTIPDQPYTEADLAFFQELGDRAALAIDNARLYREAQDAVRARDEFLSVAAHELRTPVTTVKGYAQMLLRARTRGGLASDRAAQFLAAIDESTDRLQLLADDLLDVSRLRLGQLPLRPRSLDLAQLAAGVVDRYREQLGERYRLTLEVRGAVEPVLADPDRTEQILSNLLENAAKYSPDGGAIAAAVEPAEGGVLLTVRDEGIGLPVGETETIFEPFNRGTNAVRDNLPGMGLGLYICRTIAERHGGRVWAESAGEGHGTTLRLWLPTEAAGGRGQGAGEL